MLTQRELGERAGVSQSQLSKYLRGTRSPTVTELEDLCGVLGLSIAGVISDAVRNSA